MLRDPFRRSIDYLRLSVTDRCNLRCVYCLPESFLRFTPNRDSLTDGEIEELVSCFAQLGISDIRVTGGEPLVRPGISTLIHRLSRVAGVSGLSLSTNGILLAGLARDLKAAGLQRVNISLDSLNPGTFSRITRFGALDNVMKGIEASLDAGLNPVKVNVVVARGMNDDEIRDFAALTEEKPVHVRFIELMPMGETGFFTKERWVPLSEMMERAAPLEPIPPGAWPPGRGPARYYRRPNALGTVGFISPLSCGFCSSCNRMRLSSTGTLVPCLDAAAGVDMMTPLREGAGRERLKELILDAVRSKPESHDMSARLPASAANPRFMCQIGG